MPLFGPSHDPREIELELVVAHELQQPVKPIVYSKKSSLCFVFQAGDNGHFYHWDDDTGTLHRIMAEPRTTVEEFVNSLGTWKLNSPRSVLIRRTVTGQERFNKMRREQRERDEEVKQHMIWRSVSCDNRVCSVLM
jgi:hypothetical protein